MNPTKAALPLGVVASKVTENGESEDRPATISPEKPFSFQKAFGDTHQSGHQRHWINFTLRLYSCSHTGISMPHWNEKINALFTFFIILCISWA